jgi:hypothetical protein
MTPRRSVIVGALALLATGTIRSNATAKASLESAYGFDRTWNAATRLVRVDLGLKITERDEGSGYLLFEYRSPESGTKVSSGSMEFLRRGDQSTVVLVQLPEMPQYHEQVLIDRLARKMRADYGEPPRRSEPPTRPRDGGTSPGDGGVAGDEPTP